MVKILFICHGNTHAGHVPNVGPVHTNQVVVPVVVRPGQLHRQLALTANAVLRQLFPGWGIYRIAHAVPDLGLNSVNFMTVTQHFRSITVPPAILPVAGRCNNRQFPPERPGTVG